MSFLSDWLEVINPGADLNEMFVEKGGKRMRLFSDDYYTVVVETKEEAVKFLLANEFNDEEGIEELREIDPNTKKMWFPLDELPEEYHNEEKYPRKDWCGEYIGVEITLTEALKHRQEEKPPFVICVSSELV